MHLKFIRLSKARASDSNHYPIVVKSKQQRQIEKMCTNNLLKKGIDYLQKSDLKKSRIIFESILVSDSSNPVAIHFLGVAKAKSGELEDGLKLMHLSTKLNPRKYSFKFNLASLLYSSKRYKEALEVALKAVKIRPKSAEAWRLIESITCNANPDINIKEISFNICLSLKESPAQIENYANYLYDENRYECSIKAFKHLLQQFNYSEDVWFGLGKSLKKDNNYEDAINAFKMSASINQLNTNALIHIAEIKFKQKDPKGAQKYLEKAVGIEEHNTKANYLLAEHYYNSGDLLKAELCWQNIIKFKPSEYKAQYNLGSLYIRLAKFSEATIRLEKAIELKPHLYEAYFKLSKALQRINERQKSEEILKSLEAQLHSNKIDRINIDSLSLISNVYARKARVELCKLEMTNKFLIEDRSMLVQNGYLYTMKRIRAKMFPDPCFNSKDKHTHGKKCFLKHGYHAYTELIPTASCEKLIDDCFKHNACNAQIINLLKHEGVLKKTLNAIIEDSGMPYVVWNCTYSNKSSSDETVSDTWHYDNHYAESTLKIIIYLK